MRITQCFYLDVFAKLPYETGDKAVATIIVLPNWFGLECTIPYAQALPTCPIQSLSS